MTEKELRAGVHEAVDRATAGMAEDVALAAKVLARAEPARHRGARWTLALAVTAAVMLVSTAGLAAALWQSWETRSYSGVEMIELTPKQWREYDWSHLLSDGTHLLGGYRAEEDVIAPMEAGDAITLVDGGGHAVWSLTDAQLDGALLDRVEETASGLYLGTDQQTAEGWRAALVKLSRGGELLWRYVGEEAVTLSDFAPVGEDVLCAGSIRTGDGAQGWLLCLDEAGRTRWTSTLTGDVKRLSGVCVWNERVLLAGCTDQDAVLLTLAEDGAVRELARIPVEGQITTVRLQRSGAGKLLLTAALLPAGEDALLSSAVTYAVIDVDTLLERLD